MSTIRTQLLATTAMLVLSGTAYAADMPIKAPPPVAPAHPVTNWTGFYVGGQIGGASFDPSCFTTQTNGFFTSPACVEGEGGSQTSSLSSDSFIGGGKIGYDWQFWSSAVLGVVGEFDWTHLHATSVHTQPSDRGGGTSTFGTASEQINWLASVRGRLGWAFDQVLFYGTAGVAWTQIKASASLTGTCCGGDFTAPQVSSNKTGAVAGGGFEYRVTQNVSVVGELLWYGFGSVSTTGVSANTFHTYTTTFKNQDILAGTLGVNWRF
jgi:outer membrane immunogenic protein